LGRVCRNAITVERGDRQWPRSRSTATSFTIRDFKSLLDELPPVDEEYLRAVEEAVVKHNKPRVSRDPWAR
jgi:hypothetical protein